MSNVSDETPRCHRNQLRMPHERMREDPSQRSLALGDAVCGARQAVEESVIQLVERLLDAVMRAVLDRKSTRLNSSHGYISYAVFCLKKKKKKTQTTVVIHKCTDIT